MAQIHKKFERLMMFGEVANHLSFTKAADTLSVSRGYLSEQVKRLENELGFLLFIRSTRSVKLTREGEQLLLGIRNSQQSMFELERTLRHGHEILDGEIRITAPAQFTSSYLTDLCHDFTVQHPNVRLVVDCSYVTFDLAVNDFDVAFRATVNPPDNMVAKKLFNYRSVCCASPEYLADKPMITCPDDLTKHQCLHGSNVSDWRFKKHEVKIKSWLAVNDNHMLKTQALKGRGLIMVPQYLVESELKQGLLVSVLDDYCLDQLAIYLLYPQVFNQNARLKSFIRFSQEWINQKLKS